MPRKWRTVPSRGRFAIIRRAPGPEARRRTGCRRSQHRSGRRQRARPAPPAGARGRARPWRRRGARPDSAERVVGSLHDVRVICAEVLPIRGQRGVSVFPEALHAQRVPFHERAGEAVERDLPHAASASTSSAPEHHPRKARRLTPARARVDLPSSHVAAVHAASARRRMAAPACSSSQPYAPAPGRRLTSAVRHLQTT